MNNHKLLYLSSSIAGSKFANHIQVTNMVRAFSKIYSDVVVYMKDVNGIKSSDLSLPENITPVLIKTKPGRFSNLIYSLKVYLDLRKNEDFKTHSFYSRNFICSFLLSFSEIQSHALELHAGIKSVLKKIIIQRLYNNGVKLFCISNNLKKDIIKVTKSETNIYVCHDGHNNKINQANVTVRKINQNEQIKVGYFGKLSPQKGLNLLNEIIKNSKPSETIFNIFSPDLEVFPKYESIGEYKYIKHEDCYKKMCEQDILLMLIDPQRKGDQISAYTSPLKLFEYMSSGVPILASDVPVLHEILINNMNAVFSYNYPQTFKNKIEAMKINFGMRKIISKNSIKLARKFTWDKRAQRIHKNLHGN